MRIVSAVVELVVVVWAMVVTIIIVVVTTAVAGKVDDDLTSKVDVRVVIVRIVIIEATDSDNALVIV